MVELIGVNSLNWIASPCFLQGSQRRGRMDGLRTRNLVDKIPYPKQVIYFVLQLRRVLHTEALSASLLATAECSVAGRLCGLPSTSIPKLTYKALWWRVKFSFQTGELHKNRIAKKSKYI